VQETLQSMQHKVDELERERQVQYGSLAEQLRRAHASDEALRATTESLAGALRSNATRGVWGETQLRRVVESAGLTRYVDFDTQASIVSDAGAGRPDMIVRLPGGKGSPWMPRSRSTPTSRRRRFRRRRRATMRCGAPAAAEARQGGPRAHRRAREEDLLGGLESSPEFVVCFIPSESLLAAALEETRACSTTPSASASRSRHR
jgi:DNA recombination protein RmuC